MGSRGTPESCPNQGQGNWRVDTPAQRVLEGVDLGVLPVPPRAGLQKGEGIKALEQIKAGRYEEGRRGG